MYLKRQSVNYTMVSDSFWQNYTMPSYNLLEIRGKLSYNAVGDIKIYDCRPLLADEPFKALEDDALFRAVKAEKHGYAVIWNDVIDLAESEIWLNGRPEVS